MADVILQSIVKKFGNSTIIDNLSMSINDGEFVTLLGPSGCGKTTLLRMIAGLETIDSGDLMVAGKRYNSLPAQKRRIAMVFQSYALFPHMTVQKNILFGLQINGASRPKIQQKLKWAVGFLHLNGLEDRFPREISGGQRQRVALARALVLDPDVLLLDEPLSNLDAALRETAVEELKRIHRHVGKTIIYVTHNQVEAMSMSERIALINNGRIVQYDSPTILYDSPSNIFAAEFIGSPPINLYDGEIQVEGEVTGIATDIGFLRIDKERASRLRDYGQRKVRIGIRPQCICFSGHKDSRRSTDTEIDVSVELVENLGDKYLIIGRNISGAVVRFLIARDEEIIPERKMKVFVDGRRIHIFDTSTLLNILS